jgi:hypothetical protein
MGDIAQPVPFFPEPKNQKLFSVTFQNSGSTVIDVSAYQTKMTHA